MRAFWVTLLLGLLGVRGVQPATAADVWQRDPVLSQVLVQQMATDRLGYRWIATDEGVFRYDGYELVPLRKLLRPGGAAPPEQHVRALLADKRGLLWVAADNFPLLQFDPVAGTLRASGVPPLAEAEQGVMLFLHPRTGYIWMLDGGGEVVILDPRRPDQAVFPRRRLFQPRPLGVHPLVLQPTADGGIWLSEQEGVVLQLAPDGHPVRTLRGPEPLVPVPGSVPLRLLGRSARYEADPATDQVREVARWLPLTPSTGERPYLTDSTLEWIAPQQGLLHIRRWQQTGPVVAIRPLHLTGQLVPPAQMLLEYDARGTRWAYSPIWRACYKQRPVPRVVQTLRRTGPAGPRSLASARALARLPDGRLLVSTYDGVWTQAPDSPAAVLRPVIDPTTAQPMTALFNAALPVPGGPVLVAVAFRGFHCFDPTTGCLDPLPLHPADGPPPPRYVCLLRDHAGRVWGGAEPGLFQLDLRRRITRRYAAANPRFPLHQCIVTDIAQDGRSGALWLATNAGLYHLDPATGRLHRYGEAGGIVTGRPLPTSDVLTVASAGPGRVWVGTRTEGLLLVDAVAGWQQQVGVNEGLPSPTVATLLLRHDTVWAATFAGLVRYVPRTQSLTVLTEAAGLPDAELNRHSAFADPATGILWFGGVGGVGGVQPRTLQRPTGPPPPRLLVTAVATSAPNPTAPAERQVVPAGQTPALHLAAGPTAFVELHVAITDFLAPEQVRYAYRLRQPDGPALSAWLSTPRVLLLRGVAAGDYLVEVRAETAAGQFAANLVRVPLHVAQVWWLHPAVLALVAALLLALGYVPYGLRLWRVRRDARLREALAANLHDEVGALLTRINFQAQLLRDQHRDQDQQQYPHGAPTSTEGFDRLLTNSAAAVQTMRDVVWSIDTTADSVGALLDRMRDHLDQLADSAGIPMPLHTVGLPDTLLLPSALRQHLYLIFKEAVTNAVRHAPTATEISVRLTRGAGVLTLEIVDDGPYLAPAQPPARPSSGMGLRTMRQRAEAIGGELKTGARPDGQPGYRVKVVVKW